MDMSCPAGPSRVALQDFRDDQSLATTSKVEDYAWPNLPGCNWVMRGCGSIVAAQDMLGVVIYHGWAC